MIFWEVIQVNSLLILLIIFQLGPVSCLAFSMVKDLLISGSWDKTVRTWELYSKKGHVDTFDQTTEVISLDLTPNDKEIAVATLNGELYTLDVTDASMRSI